MSAHALTTPVVTEPGQLLSREQIKSFASDGFITLPNITTPAELASMREAFRALLEKKTGEREGSLFDTVETARGEQARRSIQLTNPSNYQSWLLETDYVRNATRAVQQLLPGCFLTCDFLLLKPAKIGTGTAWHQDEAYLDPKSDHATLTVWMPLQDVGPGEGCMLYERGSHKQGVLEHRSVNGDPRAHAFECDRPIREDCVVPCPMPAGACAIHGQRTLHSSYDNVSDTDRYAYLLTFGIPPTPAQHPRSAPWLEKRCSQEQQTRRAWMLRGGAFTLMARKIRRFRHLSPAMYPVYFLRGARTIMRKRSAARPR